MSEDEKPATIYPAELPLRVFISSVMDDEMKPMRKEAHIAIGEPKYMWPWTFEYTPASAEATDENYLRHVREADAVLWLVGSKTTQPVVNEIREALSNNRPLIIMRLTGASPDEPTKKLIKEVGLRAKYQYTDLNGLREAIALSFGDEITRAWRSASPSTNRPALLDMLGRESRARCVVRWQASGLRTSEAFALADDVAIGAPADSVRPSAERQLVILQGEMGAGKSLTAERMLQSAITNAIGDKDAPIPVWLEARSVNGDDLYDAIQSKANGLGDLQRNGAFVIVNGADEAGTGIANNLLEAARLITATWPNIFIVITSRPVMRRLQPGEVASLEPLSEEASLKLVGQIAGRHVRGYDWPASIKDAVKRPFWAIILGVSLREADSQQLPQSKGELLRFLVSESLPEKSEEVQAILRRLAKSSTDRRDGPVPLAELNIGSSREDLNKTGLIVEKDRMLSFATAILTQWFAAEGLVRGEVDVAELAKDPQRLDLWRYAFVIALGEVDWARACAIMEPIVKYDVGFASEVMSEALRDCAMPGEPISLPPVLEAGQQIRYAASKLLASIGPVTQFISIARNDGTPHQLGVRTDDVGLLATWRPSDDLTSDIVELPAGHAFHAPGWGPGRWARPTTDPAWPWRWAHDAISDDLSNLIEKQRLPLDKGALFDERVWREALAVLGVGSLHPGPFKVQDIEARLARFSLNASLMSGGEVYDLKSLRARLAQFAKSGGSELVAPWPGPDCESTGGLISNMYTAERLLERTCAVYEGAIRAYAELVDRWFPTLKYRFMTYVTLPATLRGYLESGEHPTLRWYFDPIDDGNTTVDIQMATDRTDYEEMRKELEENYKRLRALRPMAQQWISANYPHTSLMEILHVDPATKLVYEWLKDDLKRIGLV